MTSLPSLLFTKLNHVLCKNIVSSLFTYSQKVTHIGSVDTNKHTAQFIEEGESVFLLPFWYIHLDHLHAP